MILQEKLKLNKTQFEKVVKIVFNKYNLNDWSFGWDNAKRRIGYCQFNKKHISLSKNFFELRDFQDSLNTLLHEIAHVLVGPNHGHDRAWKNKCVELKIEPRRLTKITSKDLVLCNYIAKCVDCGAIHEAFRRPRVHKCCGVCNNTYIHSKRLIYRRRK